MKIEMYFASVSDSTDFGDSCLTDWNQSVKNLWSGLTEVLQNQEE